MFKFDRFEELRKEKGITKTFIAEQLGRKASLCQSWKDKKAEPNPAQLRIVARLLDTTPEYLTGESDIKNPAPERDEVLRDVIGEISGLPPSDVQRVAEYVAFLKSRGGK